MFVCTSDSDFPGDSLSSAHKMCENPAGNIPQSATHSQSDGWRRQMLRASAQDRSNNGTRTHVLFRGRLTTPS